MNFRLRIIFALQLLAGLCSAELLARAGGGDSFSGGGGSGGGGGGGGGDAGAIIYLIIQLIRLLLLLWTEGGVPGKIACVVIVAGLIVAFIFWRKKKDAQKEQEIEGRVYRSAAVPRADHGSGLLELLRFDPNFSRVLFLDFAHLVYTRLQESRGKGEGSAVAPYLAPELRAVLAKDPYTVSSVVVGAINILNIHSDHERQRITVRFKSNVTEQSQGNSRRQLLEQKLTFVRKTGVLTAAPEKVLALGCPNCGSKEEPKTDGSCPSCGTVTARGQAAWQVRGYDTLKRQSVLEPVVTSAGVEEGTGAPTVVAPDLQAQLRSLKIRDEAFSLHDLTERAKHMFMEIQAGWSEIDEKRLRPYETDMLFDSHRYWLERFKEEGKRNVLENVAIERMQLAKIEHDAYFDSATLRIYASMVDYYKDRSGKVVGGNPNKPRKFSEYWTLIRRVEAAGKKSGDPAKCPSCGAPLDRVSRAGVCEYCGGKIISGAFDWVLAIITQDEEYVG